MQKKPLILALLAGLALSGAAHATLIGRDLNGSVGSFEAYYDDDLDITWLATANNTHMNWADAMTWAANLSFTDGVNTYADWRLPTTNPVNGVSYNHAFSNNGSADNGYNISEQGTLYAGSTGSEMAHLFYNTLDNKSFCDPVLSTASTCSGPQAGWGLTNTGPFTNLDEHFSYWSATEVPTSFNTPPFLAWYFYFGGGGYQASDSKNSANSALAVSPGDVGAANGSPVPEPQTLALLGLGLLGLAVARRRG